MNLDNHIRKVPDFPKEGILFYDITGVLMNPQALQYCINEAVTRYSLAQHKVDAIAAIEARGFIFAAPVAAALGLPLIVVRKKGKLPGPVYSALYELEYGQAEIEVHISDIPSGKKILLFDDLIATGGTLKAARTLIADYGKAHVTEIFGIIGLPFLHYEQFLAPTPVKTLIQYDK